MIDVNLGRIQGTAQSGTLPVVNLGVLGIGEPQGGALVEVVVNSQNIIMGGWPAELVRFWVEDSNDATNWHPFVEGSGFGQTAQLVIPPRIHLDNFRVKWERLQGTSLDVQFRFLGR